MNYKEQLERDRQEGLDFFRWLFWACVLSIPIYGVIGLAIWLVVR